ncbi:MAG: hypothetical protein HQ521_01750, partial [Bacteroidetes bacterium]|nr:hypothetical protein [Bacteroidota bacterium]
MYKHYLTIGILLVNFLYSGFNEVVGNNLSLTKYTFSEFKSDFATLMRFTCIYDADFGIPYKTVLILDVKQSSYVLLKSSDGAYQLQVNANNFDRFRKCFIGHDAMYFLDGFPVKYFKVKTEAETNDIEFSNYPGGSPMGASSKFSTLIYYAYSHHIDGNKKYVLLGTHNNYDPAVRNDLNVLVGWVLYEKKDQKQNVVLWNTNIGIRPTISDNLDLQPFVFNTDSRAYKSAVDYYSSGKKPKSKYLLVNQSGINNYQERYITENGGLNRWLPMYLVPTSPSYALRIGVVEKEAVVKQALDKFLLAEKMQIVFVLDATNSMRFVWDNLGGVLNKILVNLVNPDGEFSNIIGENIVPKIKLYYYNNTHHSMMNQNNWISDLNDLKTYEHNIDAVPIVGSPGVSPDIYGAISQVVNDVGNDPSYIVVIGDAGDSTYASINNKARNFSETPLFKNYIENMKKYIHLSGVRYDSQPELKYNNDPEMAQWKTEYIRAYDDFATNFNVIEEITPSFDIDGTANSISKSIITELKKAQDVLVAELRDSMTVEMTESEIGIFAWEYLQTIRNLKLSEGKGTYFKEGYVNIQDKNGNQLYEIDVLVEQGKLRLLKEACQEYRNNREKPELDRTLRRVIAAFFEMDWQDVDDDFLTETNLEDFWTTIVGDKEVAMRIAPELYQANYSLAKASELIAEFEQIFFQNAGEIIENCIKHLDEEYG